MDIFHKNELPKLAKKEKMTLNKQFGIDESDSEV